MDIQTNHTIQILNAKQDLVNKLYIACKKSDYGDFDLSCCLREAYLKAKLIRRLENYIFPASALVDYNCTDTNLPKLYEVMNNLAK
jgi:hypothetical protein